MDVRYFVPIYYSIYISYATQFPLTIYANIQNEVFSSTAADELNKTIIMWTKYFGGDHPLANMQTYESCRKECIITAERANYENAAAIIFHWWDIDTNDLPVRRNQQQRYIYENLESPVNSPSKFGIGPNNWFPNFFNWTMTYRSDSDIYTPYDRMLRKDELAGHEYHIYSWYDVRNAVVKKDKMVLQLVSNCYSHSGREAIVNELQKYIDVSLLGKCSGVLCDPECEKKMIERHRFYLAFENSFCDEYVTEKVWRMKQLIVPIVLQAKEHSALLPNGSFLAVDHFPSVYHLAMRLHEIAANMHEYERFFDWTKEYQYTSLSIDYKACKLCQKLYEDNVTKIYGDIEEWWQGNSSKRHCVLIAAPWNKSTIRALACILILALVAIPLALRYRSRLRFLRRRKRYFTRKYDAVIAPKTRIVRLNSDSQLAHLIASTED